MTFQVGDTVRCTWGKALYKLQAGKIYTVNRVNGEGCIGLTEYGSEKRLFSETRFQRVAKAQEPEPNGCTHYWREYEKKLMSRPTPFDGLLRAAKEKAAGPNDEMIYADADDEKYKEWLRRKKLTLPDPPEPPSEIGDAEHLSHAIEKTTGAAMPPQAMWRIS